jgi:ribosomal protein L32
MLKTSDVDVAKRRLDICKSCEHYFTPTTTCKKCGCFMIAKTKLLDASCPIGKWGNNSWGNISYK